MPFSNIAAWLAIPCVISSHAIELFCLRTILSGGSISKDTLFSALGFVSCNGNVLYPVVSVLSSDIFVDLESYKKDEVFKLIPKEKNT